jgi:hypothetical protein
VIESGRKRGARHKLIVGVQEETMTRIPSALATLATFGVITASTGHCAALLSPLRLSWVEQHPAASPPPRADAACAYDPSSRRLVLFGGGYPNYFDDTWIYDGATWTQVTTHVSPSRRSGARMAYDEVEHVLVLFGGYNNEHALNDTWLWDGATSTWTPAAPNSSPSPATDLMLFTDPLNGHVDAYGGYDSNIYQNLSRTNQWNGSTWIQLHPNTSPPPLSKAAVALDRLNHKIVMFGGESTQYNTWTWDGVDWHLESPTAQPPTGTLAGMAFEAHIQRVIVFSGVRNNFLLNETWEWTGSDWVALQPAHAPRPRYGCAMAYDDAIGSIVLFGGTNTNYPMDDTWWLAVQP